MNGKKKRRKFGAFLLSDGLRDPYYWTYMSGLSNVTVAGLTRMGNIPESNHCNGLRITRMENIQLCNHNTSYVLKCIHYNGLQLTRMGIFIKIYIRMPSK